MHHPLIRPPRHAYLATYRPPAPTFASSDGLPEVLRPVWEAMAAGQLREARTRAQAALSVTEAAPLRAALLAALAAAELRGGIHATAQTLAQTSMALAPEQWLARRLLLEALLVQQAYAEAYRLATEPVPDAPLHAWDEPFSDAERHLAAAACAWMTHDWDATAERLDRAFPDGVAAMPKAVQEDCFRLAFYRATPDAAAHAAAALIADHPADAADVLLQTLVKQGWNEQALPLYRTLFRREPQNELLRRRLVGLCIRQGALDEARTLMERGALPIAP